MSNIKIDTLSKNGASNDLYVKCLRLFKNTDEDQYFNLKYMEISPIELVVSKTDFDEYQNESTKFLDYVLSKNV